jgi:hypothetical protein
MKKTPAPGTFKLVIEGNVLARVLEARRLRIKAKEYGIIVQVGRNGGILIGAFGDIVSALDAGIEPFE